MYVAKSDSIKKNNKLSKVDWGIAIIKKNLYLYKNEFLWINQPFNTLNLSLGTGEKNEYFSAFVYAPDTTLNVSMPETTYYSRAGRPWNLVTTVKGVYAFIDYPGGSTYQRTPKLFRNIKGGQKT